MESDSTKHHSGFRMKHVLEINRQVKKSSAPGFLGKDSTISSVSSFSGVPLFNQHGRYKLNATARLTAQEMSEPPARLTAQEMSEPPAIRLNETATSKVDLFNKLNASFSVIGKWQQEAYSVFSSVSSSATDASIIENGSSFVNTSIYAAAVAAKNRTLDWLANNYHKPNASQLSNFGPQVWFRPCFVGNSASGTDTHLFKQPLAVAAAKQKVVRKVKSWYFIRKEDQFHISGRCINDRGEFKVWISRPLTFYKRITSHTFESNDHTRLIILGKFQPTGIKVLEEHPSYIVSFFSQGFPLHWEDVLVAWRTFIREGKPARFVWPSFTASEFDNQSHFSDSCDEESAFTSVSERRPIQVSTLQSEMCVAKETDTEQVHQLPITSMGRVCPTNSISLPVDKSFSINKFISTSKAGNNQKLQLVLDRLELPPGTLSVNLSTCESIYSISQISRGSIREQSYSKSMKQPASHEINASTVVQRLEDSKMDKSRAVSNKSRKSACQIRKLKNWVPYMTQDSDDKHELRLRGTLVDAEGAVLEAVHDSERIVDCLASGEIIVTSDSCRYSLDGNLSAHKAKGIPKNLHSLFIPTSVFVLSKWRTLKDSLDRSSALIKRQTKCYEDTIEGVVRGTVMEAESLEGAIAPVSRGSRKGPKRGRGAGSDSRPEAAGAVVKRGPVLDRSPLGCLMPLAGNQVACKRSSRGRLLRQTMPYWTSKSTRDEYQSIEQQKCIPSGSEIIQLRSDARGKSSSRETKSEKVRNNNRKRKINHQTVDDTDTTARKTKSKKVRNNNRKRKINHQTVDDTDTTAEVTTTGRQDRTNNCLVNGKRTPPPVLSRQPNGASKKSNTSKLKKMEHAEKHEPSAVNRMDDCSSHVTSKRKPVEKKKRETKKEIFERQKALASVRPTKPQMNLFDQSDYDISDTEIVTCVERYAGETVARVRTPKRLGTPVREYCVDLLRNVSTSTPPLPDVTGPPITDRDRKDIISYGIQRQLDLKNTKFAKLLTELKPKNMGKDKRSDVDSQVKGIYSILTKTKLPTCNVLPTFKHSFDKMNDDVYSETDSRLEMLFEASSNSGEASSNSDS